MGFDFWFLQTPVKPKEGRATRCRCILRRECMPYFHVHLGISTLRLPIDYHQYLYIFLNQKVVHSGCRPLFNASVVWCLTTSWWTTSKSNYDNPRNHLDSFPVASVIFSIQWSAPWSVQIVNHDRLRYGPNSRMAHTTAKHFLWADSYAFSALFNKCAGTHGLCLYFSLPLQKETPTFLSHASLWSE